MIPCLNKKGLYSNNDLQAMIVYIRDNCKKEFFDSMEENSDNRAIKSVIDKGYYEEFNRYDSEVAEKFIRYYNIFFEKSVDR